MLEILLDKLEEFLDQFSKFWIVGFIIGAIWVPWLMLVSGILLATQAGIPDLKEIIAGLVKLTVTEE